MKSRKSITSSLPQLFRWLMAGMLMFVFGVPSPVYAAGWDLSLEVTDSGDFIEGGTGHTYTLIVRNIAGIEKEAGNLVTLDFAISETNFTATAISGTGWSCDLGTLTCTRSDVLPVGSSYPPVTITVNVAIDTPDNPNTVDQYVSVTSVGDVDFDNNAEFYTTTVQQIANLTVEKTHTPEVFIQGKQGTYTIKVKNLGGGSTNGLVTVTDTLPDGLTAQSISGTGWSCILATLTCTRSDMLGVGEEYPVINLIVSVDLDAEEEETNDVSVSGGGDLDTDNNYFSDVTNINLRPDLKVTDYQLLDPVTKNPLVGNPQAGEPFLVRLSVLNQGGADTPGVFYRSVYVDGLGDYLPGHPDDDMDYEFFSQLGITTIPPHELAGCLYYNDPENSTRGTFFTDENFLGIPAGGTDTQNSMVEVSGLDAGTYDLYFYADPTCLTEEANEDNNYYGPITVNVGTQVDVTIGGNFIDNYFLISGQSIRQNYPIIDAGPVVVQSVDGSDIVVALREMWNSQATGLVDSTSFAQLMGIAKEKLTDTYYLPHYNDLSPYLDAQLRFGNVDSIPTKVTITIGGVDYGPFPSADPSDNLDPGESYRINFPDIDAGPVVVTSSNGAKIVVALREMWNSQATGLVDSTSFTQIMGIPKEELTDTYYLPHYNDLSPYLDAQLRFGVP